MKEHYVLKEPPENMSLTDKLKKMVCHNDIPSFLIIQISNTIFLAVSRLYCLL